MTNPVKWLFSKEADEGCVPNRELVTYAAGMSGQSANGIFIKDYLLYYLTDVAGVESSFSGIITGLSKVWDAVNDPLVGAYIDNRKCADGSKFHSYLSRLPFIVGLFSCLIFFNLSLSGVPQIAVICAAYFLWDFFYSFQETAIWGTVSLMSPHAKERDRSTQWIYIGANTGGALTALVPLAMGIVKTLGIGEKTFLGFRRFLRICLRRHFSSFRKGEGKSRLRNAGKIRNQTVSRCGISQQGSPDDVHGHTSQRSAYRSAGSLLFQISARVQNRRI